MATEIFPQNLGIHSAITANMVAAGLTIRATVGMMLIDRDSIVFVRSRKAPEDLSWCTLPQEGVKFMDRSVRGTFVRGLNEELKLRDHHVDMRTVKYLMVFHNKLPSDRTEGGQPTVKEIAYFAVRLKAGGLNAICPNPQEIAGIELASSWEQVDQIMATVAEHRVHKYIATCLAIRAACRTKMLSWHVPAFMDARLNMHEPQLVH